MNIKVIVAAHKPFEMPKDPLYLPLHVGKEGKEGIGFQGDHTGDNISADNPYFSELTGLYWAWKNLDADYIGLVHYRRHFRGKNSRIISGSEVEEILQKFPVILPRKRNYFI